MYHEHTFTRFNGSRFSIIITSEGAKMVTPGNVYLKRVNATNLGFAFLINHANGTRQGQYNVGIQLPAGTEVLVDDNNLHTAPGGVEFIESGSLILIVSHTNTLFNGKLAETATPIDVTDVKLPRAKNSRVSKKAPKAPKSERKLQ
ncbi:MAG: hypothetical protein IPH85_14010 [Ignavibacteria bacterium]|nr:hypothetical protein [Ignavibacteria bacterium]